MNPPTLLHEDIRVFSLCKCYPNGPPWDEGHYLFMVVYTIYIYICTSVTPLMGAPDLKGWADSSSAMWNVVRGAHSLLG